MLPSVTSHSYMEGSTQDSSKNGKNQKGPKEAHGVLLANYTLGIEIHVLPPFSNSERNNKRKEGRKRKIILQRKRDPQSWIQDQSSQQGIEGLGDTSKAFWGYLLIGKFSPPWD